MSPGARLAAAKAAKAARKAAKLGKDKKDERAPFDRVRETELAQRAQVAGEWAQRNRIAVYSVVAALLLGVAGWVGWRSYDRNQAEAAAALLTEAIEIGRAEIRAEGEEAPETDDETRTFPYVSARAEAELEAYRAVLEKFPGQEAAAWAHLGAGDALLELERYEEARSAFEQALAVGGNEPTIASRALEGKGFTYEAEENWPEALEVYQELSRVADRRFEPAAKYHIARIAIAQGRTEQATQTLNTLVEELREASDDERQQDFSYVLAQAEIRLRELDPSAVPARSSLGGTADPFGGGGLDQLTPEQREELIRMMQKQMQNQGE